MAGCQSLPANAGYSRPGSTASRQRSIRRQSIRRIELRPAFGLVLPEHRDAHSLVSMNCDRRRIVITRWMPQQHAAAACPDNRDCLSFIAHFWKPLKIFFR